jgi:hypothetical protein
MVDFKKAIFIVTALLFVYNAFFTYIIVQLTAGAGRFVFLILVSLDYIIIFYLVISIANQLKRDKQFRSLQKMSKRSKR